MAEEREKRGKTHLTRKYGTVLVSLPVSTNIKTVNIYIFLLFMDSKLDIDRLKL